MPYPYNYPMYPTMGVPAAYPQQPTPQQNTPQQQPEQLVNGGFAVVPAVEDIKRYPVAPGHFVIFKLQNTPYIIEKSMSYSQLDDPHYKCFQEVDEDIVNNSPKTEKEEKSSHYEEEIGDIKENISRMDEQIEKLKNSLLDVKKSIKPVPKKTAKLSRDDEEDGDAV